MRVSGSSTDGLMALLPFAFLVGLLIVASGGPMELLSAADVWLRHTAHAIYAWAMTLRM